ncbi:MULTISPECIES: helix-turn-helix transcriptional regulator [unclassified Brevibacterium]|uniref:helix-turn-helix transcriptional regulator n=1 Tax=unclassified Brevibacterium TaxID=2614124 RepID=UPI001092FF68|nr:helix-turn-helix transcriptional regulator [Brevibacterium sp. S22]TGD30988.1 AraC family transcriptional regulator [Brevibacterium sp. S22]
MSAVRPDGLVRAPHPRLRPYVGDYVGYDIAGVPAGTHLGLPSGMLTFIVALDRPLLQVDEATDGADAYDVLLAGLHLRRTLIRHDGAMSGIQINFSPMAPRALFGIPAAEFAHHSVDLARISRPLTAELHERVNRETEWSARFAAIDDVLIRTIDDANRPRAEVVAAWHRIIGSHGGVPVSLVADDIGWSRRHLGSQFRSEYGIGPKDAARIVRFDRARRLIPEGRASLAEIAVDCGYADQAHLNRDFREFVGLSPSRWLAADDVARRHTAGTDSEGPASARD